MDCQERRSTDGRYCAAVRDAVQKALNDRRLMSLVLRTNKQSTTVRQVNPVRSVACDDTGKLWQMLYTIRAINVDRSKWRPLLLAETVDVLYERTGGFSVPWGGMCVAEPVTTIGSSTLEMLSVHQGSWRTPEGVAEMIELGLPDILVLEALRYSRYRASMSTRVTMFWLQIAEGRRSATGTVLGSHVGASLRGILLSASVLRDVEYPEVVSELYSNLTKRGIDGDAALEVCGWFNAGDLWVIENVLRLAPNSSRDEVAERVYSDCLEAKRMGLGRRAASALLESWTDLVTDMHGGTTYSRVGSGSGGCFRSVKLYSMVGLGPSRHSSHAMSLSLALGLPSSVEIGYYACQDGTLRKASSAPLNNDALGNSYLPACSTALGDEDMLQLHMEMSYGAVVSVRYVGDARRQVMSTFVPYSELQAHEVSALLTMDVARVDKPVPAVWLQGSFDPYYVSDAVVAAEEARRVPGPVGVRARDVLRELYESIEVSKALSGSFWLDQLLTASAEGVIQAPWYQTEKELLSDMSDATLTAIIERDVSAVDMRVYERSFSKYSCDAPCTIMANSGAVIAAARRSRGGIQLTPKAHAIRSFLGCAPARYTQWDRCGVLSLQPKYWMDIPDTSKNRGLEDSVLKTAAGSTYTPVESACYTASDTRLARAGALDIASAALYYVGVRITGIELGRLEFEEVVRKPQRCLLGRKEGFFKADRPDVITSSSVVCTGSNSLMGHLEDSGCEVVRGPMCTRVPVYVRGVAKKRRELDNWLDGMEYCTRARVCRSVTPLYGVSEAMRAAGFVLQGDEYTYGVAKKAYPQSVRIGLRNRYAVRVRKFERWRSLLREQWFVNLCGNTDKSPLGRIERYGDSASGRFDISSDAG